MTKTHQEDWRELLVFDIIGNRIHLTMRGMRQALAHRYMVLFAILTIALLVLLNTHDYRAIMPLGATIVLWTVCVVTLIGLYVLLTTALILLSRRVSGLFVYYPIVGIVAMSVNTFLTSINAALLSGQSFQLGDTISNLPLNYAIGLVFEAIFVVFVYPLMLQDDKQLVPISVVKGGTILIAGKRFQCDEIRSVSSQDHYVEVTTVNEKLLLRARLVDVANQLSEVEGIMPHRSHWVAKSAVIKLAGNANKKMLVLDSGLEVPVARGRVASVRNWLEG